MTERRDDASADAEDAPWLAQWRGRIRSVDGLHRHLRRRGMAAAPGAGPAASFPVRVTPYYAGLIRRADPSDPIYRQCVPAAEETACRACGSARAGADPFGEMTAHQPAPGIIRRYRDRAVLLVSNTCAVHCRHCTRRHALCGGMPVVRARQAQAWLQGERDLREVLLSGGDPLSLSDRAIERLLRCVRAAPHIEIIRVGTRMPVVLPQRITARLVACLAHHAPVWVATHFNHPAELTPEAERACTQLAEAGIPVVNQAVLLHGVNDRAEVLEALFRGLLRFRVRPYYLLHCDPVAGTDHFRVPVGRGLALMDRLRAQVSGLALPVYAADVPGATGKVPLSRRVLLGRAPGGLRIRLPGGGEALLPGE